MASFYGIFGIVLGALGFLALFQLVGSYIYSFFPSEKIQALDGVLDEVDDLIVTAVDEDLLGSMSAGRDLQNRLALGRKVAENLRMKSYLAYTDWLQLRATLSGLTREVLHEIEEAEILRADISAALEVARIKADLIGNPETRPNKLYQPPSIRRKKGKQNLFKVYKPFDSFRIPPGMDPNALSSVMH